MNYRVDEKLAVQISIRVNGSKSNGQPIWGTISQELIRRLMNRMNQRISVSDVNDSSEWTSSKLTNDTWGNI